MIIKLQGSAIGPFKRAGLRPPRPGVGEAQGPTPLHQLQGSSGRGAARGIATLTLPMQKNRLRHDQMAKSLLSQAQAKINIIEFHGQFLIETTHQLEQLTSHHHASTGHGPPISQITAAAAMNAVANQGKAK